MRALFPLVIAAALVAKAGAGDDVPAGTDVTFLTPDGVSIAATWYPPADGTPLPTPAVVALPMYRSTRNAFEPMARPVTDRGMGLLAIERRPDDSPSSLHGTRMFGRVADIEENAADWLALHVAFHRIELADGSAVRVGSTGAKLYVGLETAATPAPGTPKLRLRIGLGPVTEPWTKERTLDVGEQLSSGGAGRMRTRISRDTLGAEPGVAFAVAVSLGTEPFRPADGEPSLRVMLR